MSLLSGFNFVALLCAVAIGFALNHTIQTHLEVATVVLTIPILAISLMTLWFSIPKKAKISVTTLDEAEYSDLVFFLDPQTGLADELQLPGEYLFQLKVAISNIGDRKAIVSSIKIKGFKNNEDHIVHLPNATEAIEGVQWIQRSGSVNGQDHFEN